MYLLNIIRNFINDIRDRMEIYRVAEVNGWEVNSIIRSPNSLKSMVNVSPNLRYTKTGRDIIAFNSSIVLGNNQPQWITI